MRLSTKMSELNTKQVRVDNWGIFFLQRLQLFFSKTDYCDMTLQFEGNVQLKVHRLVMNACTDYFQFLEQTCTTMDNVIMMPADLQADVIVPIVNFMYTGMLEFHLSIFDRLYKTAQVMNITILTKLLDAQKQSVSSGSKFLKKKASDPVPTYNLPVKKPQPKQHPDLPATLPGRKLPVWKRKSIPSSSMTHPQSHSVSSLCHPEPKWTPTADPLLLPDNTPKPTRFEWPDDDLPPIAMMDTSFEDISYNSKPLMTREEEMTSSTSFDDLKQIPNASRSTPSTSKKGNPSSSLDMEEMKNYVKEQKIRSGLSSADEEYVDNDLDSNDSSNQSGTKRKLDLRLRSAAKKVRFEENDKGTTISIASDGKIGSTELNHSKIVSEIMKKYPQLMKKNKNIRLKIMAKNKAENKVESILKVPKKMHVVETIVTKRDPKVVRSREPEVRGDDKGPWACERCSTDEEPMEFVLYYLFRKHMTDVHNERFDPLVCKYCGHQCNNENLMMYHLYTKHGMKPPNAYNFPKCNLCPFIALSHLRLNKHKLRHNKNEIQCVDCKLAFTSQATLTSHMQITGHNGKSNKNNYDCQYCTKRYTSGVNLFSHVRLQHRNDAIRDGIVSIDENDDLDEFGDDQFDDDSIKDEYILPEIMSEASGSPKKVNILQNVKVQDRHEQRAIALEPSSEAEALNNVASGIATSLGLVDIVVLNDNQQLFLQPDQQDYGSQSSDQSEFILPELTGSESYVQEENDEVIAQSMLSEGDMASTDELVMVLTDHDYGDNQEEMSNENSNIVVLYSHPVDGQQDQFITSQGNIMVNSETGLIEIRNGATITTTTTANQVIMTPQENQIESIEMIQREIESHVELKSENVYDDDSKPLIDAIDEDNQQESIQQPDEPTIEANDDQLLESLPETHEEVEPVQQEQSMEVTEEDLQEIAQETQEVDDCFEERATVDDDGGEKVDEDVGKVDNDVDKVDDGGEKVDEPQSTELMECEAHPPGDEPQEENTENDQEEPQAETEEKVDSPQIIEQLTPEGDGVLPQTDPVSEEAGPEEQLEDESTGIDEDKVGDDPVAENPKDDENVAKKIGHQGVVDQDNTLEFLAEKEGNEEISQVPMDLPPPTTDDNNSQSSQESKVDEANNVEDNKDNQTTKISILDDWEDTDSQQSSEHKEHHHHHHRAKEVIGEAVNKLMDDWEEEDEDDGRKEAE